MLGLHAKLATVMSALGLIGVGALNENTAVFNFVLETLKRYQQHQPGNTPHTIATVSTLLCD